MIDDIMEFIGSFLAFLGIMVMYFAAIVFIIAIPITIIASVFGIGFWAFCLFAPFC